MSDKKPLNVVIGWHMHQPQYCDLTSGHYHQPWTYLHAIKDYVDMIAHIEAVPGARAVVNFAPVLLEQIDDYRRQVEAHLENGRAISDPLLNALGSPVLPTEIDQQLHLVRSSLRANQQRLVERFPMFRMLSELGRWTLDHPDALHYLDGQFLTDLLVWYHLAWMGETVRRQDARIRRLQDKGQHFSLHDRRELMTVIGEILAGVIPRYRRMAEQGRIELSVTPYAHPIVPLLLDFKSTREAMPEAPLPRAEAYPGGQGRAEWHIEKGRQVFKQYFGFQPNGCWPAEGAVSTDTLKLLEKHGFRWAATGESVLLNSIKRDPKLKGTAREAALFKPYHLPGGRLSCFFRDDGLSDAVGFTYSDWHADDAVANLVHNLTNIAAAAERPERQVVSIILDGENAWEHYPENGYYFLSALYEQLAAHPRINLTTFSDVLKRRLPATRITGVVAGSWVYGTLSTWMGEADKNRGWDMLVDVKQAVDRAVQANRLTAEQLQQVEHYLAICEGSDWFWWFGDYNPSDSVQDFELLYRQQLANLYQLLGEEPPEYLAHAFSFGSSKAQVAHGGVMRHGQAG